MADESLIRLGVRAFARACCNFLQETNLIRWFVQDVANVAEMKHGLRPWVPTERTAYLIEIQGCDLFDAAQCVDVAGKYSGVRGWEDVARAILEDDRLWHENVRFCGELAISTERFDLGETDPWAVDKPGKEELLQIGAELRREFRSNPLDLLPHLKFDLRWNNDCFIVVFEDEGMFAALETELKHLSAQ